MSETIDLNQQDVKFQAPPDLAAGRVEGGQELVKKRAHFVYRDNQLLHKYAPDVAKGLTALDYQVTEQVFPEGTPEADYKAWVEAHAKELTGADELVTDETFSRAVGSYDELKRLGLESKGRGAALDTIMNRAALRAVLGPDYKSDPNFSGEDGDRQRGEMRKDLESDMGLEQSRELFLTIIQNILSDPNNRPDNIIILTEKLADHSPFSQIAHELRKQASKKFHEELAKLVPGLPPDAILNRDDERAAEQTILEQLGIDPYNDDNELKVAEIRKDLSQKRTADEKIFQDTVELNPSLSDTYDELLQTITIDEVEDPKIKAGEIIFQWVTEAGLENVKIVERIGADEQLTNKTWVFTDRHAATGRVALAKTEAVKMPMPLSNLFSSCQENGLFRADENALRDAIEVEVKTRFGKKE